MLNKVQINEPHNCPCIVCNEWQLWQAWRVDGWKLFFSGSVHFKRLPPENKTNPSAAQGVLSGWQEESRSIYWRLLFFK